jgi:hypothetical protein
MTWTRFSARTGLPLAGGHLDRGGAVVGREVVPAGEPRDGGDVADDGAAVDRTDADDLGDAGARAPDHGGEFLLGRAQLGIEAAQVLEERHGELEAGSCSSRPAATAQISECSTALTSAHHPAAAAFAAPRSVTLGSVGTIRFRLA